MSNTYYTQVFTSDGSNKAYNVEADNAAPYVTYNCKNTVNLNFLLREVLFCDPESITVGSDDAFGTNRIHIVPTYNTELDAKSDTDGNRYSDVSNTHGHYYAMRLINALMRTQIDPSEQTTLDTYLKHYGGYKNGLSNGSSNNTSNPNTATMDFAEFFQVALSAVRNKETDAVTTGVNGLVDRENINNAAVNGDLNQRTVDNTSASSLLRTMIGSSRKLKTLTEGQIINDSSEVNWLKQLVYSIIQNTSTTKGGVGASEENERYRSIRRSGLTSNEQERFMQLKLQDGDSIVFTFIFNLSNADNTSFNNEQPDSPGTPITVGFRVQHSDTAAEFAASGDSILPIGWTDEYFTGLVMTLLFGIGTDAASLRQTNIDDGIANTKVVQGQNSIAIIKADNTLRLLGGTRAYVPYYWDSLIGNNVHDVIVAGNTNDGTQYSVLYGTEGSRQIASWYTALTSKRSTMGGCPTVIQNLTDVKEIHTYDYDCAANINNLQHDNIAIYGPTRQVKQWRCDGNTGISNDVLVSGGGSILANIIKIYSCHGSFAATVDNLDNTYDIVSFGNYSLGGGLSGTDWTVINRATGLLKSTQSVKLHAISRTSIVFYMDDMTMVGWKAPTAENYVAQALAWAGTDLQHIVGISDREGYAAANAAGDMLLALSGYPASYTSTYLWGSTPMVITKAIANYDTVIFMAVSGTTTNVRSYSHSSSLSYSPGAGGAVYATSFAPTNNVAIDIMADGFLSLVKRTDNTCKIWGWPKLTTPETDINGTTKILSRNGQQGQSAMAVKADGSVHLWTYNEYAGYAIPNNGMQSQLTSGIADIYHTYNGWSGMAIRTNNNAKLWGYNTFINNQDATIGNNAITDIRTTKSSVDLIAHCALLADGSIKTWGTFSHGGDLSQPTWTGVDNTVALSSGVTKIVSHDKGFVALKDNNKIYTWGSFHTQGPNFWNSSFSPLNVSDIFANESSFALLRTDGNVSAWSGTFAAITITGISGNCTNIVASSKNYCALKSDNTISAFGVALTTGGGSTQLTNDATANSFVSSGITSVVGTKNGFIARKADGTAVYWGDNNSNVGIMTGVIDISEANTLTAPIAVNKVTSSYLVGASLLSGTDLTRLQLKPIIKAVSGTYAPRGGVLNKDATVDAWGAEYYNKLIANTNQLKNELHDIDFMDVNSSTLVARRSTDNRLFIICANTNYARDIITEADPSLFVQGLLNNWYYVEDVIKVYSNKSVFIAVRSDYSTVVFGDYLELGGFIPAGFDMSRTITQIKSIDGFHLAGLSRSFFLKYT
jgi:hypothetical protein